MVNHKKYNLLLIILLTSILFQTNNSLSSGKNITPEYVYGKVVYSDNNAPVNNGNVTVRAINISGESGKVFEKAEINENGEFRLSRNIIQQTDEMEIMAYANDLDNIEFQFETRVSDLKSALKTSDGKFDIILTVNRISNTNSKD